MNGKTSLHIINQIETKTFEIKDQFNSVKKNKNTQKSLLLMNVKNDSKTEKMTELDRRGNNIGFIAQDIEKLLPNAVKTTKNIISNISRYCYDFSIYKKTRNGFKYAIKINDLRENEKSPNNKGKYEFHLKFLNQNDNKLYNKRLFLIQDKENPNEFLCNEMVDNIKSIYIKGFEINNFKALNTSDIYVHHTSAIKELINKYEKMKMMKEKIILFKKEKLKMKMIIEKKLKIKEDKLTHLKSIIIG